MAKKEKSKKDKKKKKQSAKIKDSVKNNKKEKKGKKNLKKDQDNKKKKEKKPAQKEKVDKITISDQSTDYNVRVAMYKMRRLQSKKELNLFIKGDERLTIIKGAEKILSRFNTDNK